MNDNELKTAIEEIFGVDANKLIKEGVENMHVRYIVGGIVSEAQSKFMEALKKWAEIEGPALLPVHHITSAAYELLNGAAFLFALSGSSSVQLSSRDDEGENAKFIEGLTETYVRDCLRVFNSAMRSQLKKADLLNLLDPNAKTRAEIMKELQD